MLTEPSFHPGKRFGPAPLPAVACLALLLGAAGPAGADGEPESPAASVPAPSDTATETAEAAAPDLPSPRELEARQATIGTVTISVEEIFDESDPREDRWLYRLANDLHMTTRDGTVREWLLFKPGDPYSAQKTEETARLLRTRKYLAEADVVPTAYDPVTNTVDLNVRVRDVWTLEAGFNVGRSGGENKSRLKLADENLLGFGQKVGVTYKSDVDRSGVGVQFSDPNVFESFWGLQANYTDNTDGSVAFLNVERPFFSLDSRWSAGFLFNSSEQTTSLYELGEKVSEFDSDYQTYAVQGGVSRGLVNGWTRRWLGGYRYDRAEFTPTPDSDLPPADLPEDRLLSYPWVGVELVEDRFATTRNRDQIGRIEDLFLGRRMRASIGWASPAFGSDRSAAIFGVGGDMGLRLDEFTEMQFAGAWDGRLESGNLVDAVVSATSRYYYRFNADNVFAFSVAGAHADNLDLDQQLQLGGDNGLRGYPLRYQTGETRLQATVEERHYTDWFPFRLVRVGGAVFFDVGRMWGGDPQVTGPQDTLMDVGFGLRLGNARTGAGGSVFHIDLAFPLNAPDDISSVQFLFEAQSSF